MADFLPIKLGKNANGAVTHLQEISLSDKIPESYLQVSSNTVAKWNASSIQGVLVSSLSPEQGYTLVYSSSVSAWVPSTISVDAQTVALTIIGNTSGTGNVLDPSSQQVRQIFVSNDGTLLSVSSTSAMPPGSFYVASGGGFVPAFLPDSLLRFFGANGSYPTKAPPAELAKNGGEILYYDVTNNRYTNTGDLKVIGANSLLATNVSATNVSATNYLNIGNTTAKWNASAIQGSPVSASLNPSTNQLLIYNGSVWTASTITTVTDHGALTGLADDDHPQYVLSATNNALSSTVSNHIASASVHFTQAQIDHGTIAGLTDNDHPQYVLSSTNSALSSLVDNHIASASVHFTQAQIDHGSILGLSDNDHPQYVLSATNSSLSSTVSNHIASSTVHFTQAQIDHGVILGLADNDHPQYVLSATNSALSSLVSNHIASASVHFTQAEIDHGVILGLGDNDHPQYVLSATNSALSSTVSNHIASAVHWDLATLNINYINASGDSANAAFYFQTVSATTVSATNYLNLPSSPVTIPDPLTVSTLYAGLVSATEYRNVRPYVSSVDSATTTTVNINGGYDTYLVNTTTTSVTLYLPDASAYPSRKITVSKIDDGGSYRSVTLSGAQLQTATNTVRLYDPTESVTVISNGTNWYSMDYDRAYGVVLVCKNNTGVTLAKGTPVRVTGATGDNVLIGPVSAANNHVPEATNGDLSRCIGVVEHAIPTGEFGHVLTKGTIYKFNTDAYNEGDILYLAPSGGFTNVKPASPYDEVFLGIVTRKQAVNGSILIDVANPIHINDIVGFDLTSSLVNGDLISYSTATSTFTNVQTVNVSGQGKFGSVSATNYFNLPSGVATWNANKLQGYDISAVAPSNDQVLKYNSTLSAWVPGTDNTGGGGGGGIADASSLRGVPLSATLVPTAGQALMYNGSVWTASAALFAYTYGSGAPTGGSDGDIYLQTDVVALQVPAVSATTYYNLPSGTLVWTYATSATSALYATNATSATLALNATNATSATSALNAQQAPAGFSVTGSITATTVSSTNLLTTSGDLTTTKLTDYSESKSSPTISSSALTLDLNNSQVFTVALNSNISTLTISNVEARANTAQGFTLILTADGTARTISWPGSVKWPSGTGPTLTSTNTKVDILSFLTPDNGTTWYGFVGGQNF